MIDIRADLFSATGKNADSFHVDFVETDSIALDWKPVGDVPGCQKKTIMLHLPDGWEKAVIRKVLRYVIAAPDGKCWISTGNVIEGNAIKVSYEDKNGDKKEALIPFTDLLEKGE